MRPSSTPSRRFGNAVARNRAKRVLREIFRRQEPDTVAHRRLRPLDLVVRTPAVTGVNLVQPALRLHNVLSVTLDI